VHEMVLNSGWETFLLAIPCVFMLLVVVFRLDALFVSPRGGAGKRRPASGMDESGRPMLSDPDGRAWHPKRHRN
jgi:hypothetical protein